MALFMSPSPDRSLTDCQLVDSNRFDGDIRSFKDRRVHSESAFGTTIEFRFFSEWPHTLKRGFMTMTETHFPGDITEEELLQRLSDIKTAKENVQATSEDDDTSNVVDAATRFIKDE